MEMGGKDKSTKGLIIGILGNQFPLSLKTISRKVRETRNVSYQAVHKAIKELVSEEIVEKIDKQYFLNKQWVKEQTKSFSKYYSNYFHISYNANQIDNSKIQVFRFTSLKDVLNFVVEAITKGHINREGSNKVYISVRRLHPLIPQSLIQIIKTLLKENEIYIICRSDKFSDRWTATLFRSLGIKVKTRVNILHQNAVCFGDCVLQYFLFFDESYKKKVHVFSDRFKEKSSMKLLKMTSNIFHKKAEMYIIINRYPVFVQDIQQSVSNEFESVFFDEERKLNEHRKH